MLNKSNDDFWKNIDGINRTKTLKVPVLLLGGWFDPFLPTQIADFQDISSNADQQSRKYNNTDDMEDALSSVKNSNIEQ